MSDKATFQSSDITNLSFATDPPGISFQHKDQKYWIYTGKDDSKEWNQGLMLHEGLRNSFSITIYDSGADANGYNILSSISFRSLVRPQTEDRSFALYLDIALVVLLACIVALLSRHIFFPRKQ